jgi:hypothetical protein
MASLSDFKKKVQQTYASGDLGLLQSWATGYASADGRAFAQTYASQLQADLASRQAAQQSAAGGSAAAQLAASQGAPAAGAGASAAAGEAQAMGGGKLNTGRKALIQNRKGVLGMAQEFAKTRKTKLGA